MNLCNILVEMLEEDKITRFIWKVQNDSTNSLVVVFVKHCNVLPKLKRNQAVHWVCFKTVEGVRNVFIRTM